MADKDQGFTLIELLVVIIIIGILAAIAIPVFLNQRKKAVDASLKSDLHNAAVIVETWAVDHPGDPIGAWQVVQPTPEVTSGVLTGLRLSPGTRMVLGSSPTVGAWCLFAQNPNASKATGPGEMLWKSQLGGLEPSIVTGPSSCP